MVPCSNPRSRAGRVKALDYASEQIVGRGERRRIEESPLGLSRIRRGLAHQEQPHLFGAVPVAQLAVRISGHGSATTNGAKREPCIAQLLRQHGLGTTAAVNSWLAGIGG